MPPKGKAKDATIVEINEVTTVEVANTPKPKKKGENVNVLYLDSDRKEYKTIPDDCVGFRTKIGPNGSLLIRDTFFADLPDNIKIGFMAFGGNVAARNAVNTAESVEDGVIAFSDRFDNFARGVWREAGTGESALPLCIEAVGPALVKYLGKSQEEADARTAHWTAQYRAQDENADEKVVAAHRKAIRAQLEAIPQVKLMMAEITAKRSADRLAKLQATAGQSGEGLAAL